VLINSGEFLDQKLRCIHDITVMKGYVENPEHWKFSGAWNYLSKDHSIIRNGIMEQNSSMVFFVGEHAS